MNLSVDRPSKSSSLVHQWEIQDPSGWSRCTPIWGCSSIYMWSFNHIPEKNNMGNIDTHVYLYNWGYPIQKKYLRNWGYPQFHRWPHTPMGPWCGSVSSAPPLNSATETFSSALRAVAAMCNACCCTARRRRWHCGWGDGKGGDYPLVN